MSWYILHCRSGRERELIRSLRQRIPGFVLQNAFLFSCDRMRKYLGEWHTDRQLMFPGYVFLETEVPEELLRALKQYRGAAEILEDRRGRLLLPVKPEEEKRLRFLFGEERHLGMSAGIERGSGTEIISGPLRGKERLIKKINRHKRVAVLNMSLSDCGGDLWAGLELLREEGEDGAAGHP